MLTQLEEFIKNLESFSIEEETKKIVYVEDEEILALVRGQMSLGLDGNDEPITWEGRTFYKPFTIQVKKAFGSGLGAETEWITLYMTGEFYASLYVNYSNGKFQVLSRDQKYPVIRLKSGQDILELNTVNLETIQNQANEFLQEDFNKLFK
jgi:hypothetical protein